MSLIWLWLIAVRAREWMHGRYLVKVELYFFLTFWVAMLVYWCNSLRKAFRARREEEKLALPSD